MSARMKILNIFLKILIFTGRRRSEVLSIKRNDVDMKNKCFKVVYIRSEDKHKDKREIPEEVIKDFRYF